MSNFPYSKYNPDDMILRDHLALDRTILANERTLLAYVRTAFTVFVVGLTFIKFFDDLFFIMVGFLFIPLGLLVFVIGIRKYRQMERSLDSISK